MDYMSKYTDSRLLYLVEAIHVSGESPSLRCIYFPHWTDHIPARRNGRTPLAGYYRRLLCSAPPGQPGGLNGPLLFNIFVSVFEYCFHLG